MVTKDLTDVDGSSQLRELIAKLPPEAATIVCDYRGEDDSADHQNTLVYNSAGHAVPTTDELRRRIHNTLEEAIVRLNHSWWWNGDGASGEIVVDLAKGTYQAQHREYEKAVKTFDYESKL